MNHRSDRLVTVFSASRTMRLVASAAVLALAAHSAPAVAGSWAPLNSTAPLGSTGTMMLLSDGRVMLQGDGYSQANWQLLTPNSTGSYIDGSYSYTAPMGSTRLYFASHVLRDGRVWVLGGEYSNKANNWTRTGEIYDPVSNAWAPIAPHPEGQFGDVPSMLLDGDRILAGSLFTRDTYIYTVSNNTWSGPIPKANSDRSDEETWVKLSNGQVLTYNLFQSIYTGGAYAEKFDPVANAWNDISPSNGTALGNIPQLSSAERGYEMGPALRLQDGRIFQIGATSSTALYNPTTNTWSAGPENVGWGSFDAPAAILPNGHVLFAASPTSLSTSGATNCTGSTLFLCPTRLFEFNPATSSITPVNVPAALASELAAYSWGASSYETRMLMLPTGQLLFSTRSARLWVYTPDGPINPAMRPVINQIIQKGGGHFSLAGKQLNGQSSGSSYGDDAESDENYPIIRMTHTSSGKVYYQRSSNWSHTNVGPGPETVDFNSPAGMPSGRYSVVAVGAGIPSAPVFTYIP